MSFDTIIFKLALANISLYLLFMSETLRGRSVFVLLASIFKKHSVNPVLVGGYAFIASKVLRTTFDIDFMITAEDESKIEPDIISAGYAIRKRQGAFIQFRADKQGLRDLDVLVTDKDTLHKLIQNGRRVCIAGEMFVVPSPIHLIAMKLHAIANNPECRRARESMPLMGGSKYAPLCHNII